MAKKQPYNVLVVDDDEEWHEILRLLFNRKGWTVYTALNGITALGIIEKASIDVVLCDLSMPKINGMEVLKRIRLKNKNLPFIMMTGVGSIESAVEAVQLGAYSYLTKPINNTDLTNLIERAAAHKRLQESLEKGKTGKEISSMIFGTCPAVRKILETVSKVAATKVPILIQGETGTGKTMLARYIHNTSSVRDKVFLTVDCSALPESLLESELFGHVKGSFTGAVTNRKGLLEEAQGGTVFLDEIGELTSSMQAKLLRAVQEREIRPVGSNKSVSIDVRFIAATFKNLEDAVKQHVFREDLYYRLSVIPLRLPALRERKEDLPAFIGFFIQRFNERYGLNITQISPAAMRMLSNQEWKGNIRELENTLERACLLTEGDSLTTESLAGIEAIMPSSAMFSPAFEGPIHLADAVRAAEKQALQHALALANGNKTQAADMLGIGRRTLYDKLEQFSMLDKKDL